MNLKTIVRLLMLHVVFVTPLWAQDETAKNQPPTPAKQQEALNVLLKRQEVIQEMLPKLEQATVCLQAGGGSGSGVIVSKDGLVLTAAHVVGDNKQMTVRFSDGRSATGRVLGVYRPADAGMLQIVEKGPYPFVDVAPAKSLKSGQSIIALGHPSGFDLQRGIPLRVGHVGSLNGDFFASDCALNGGDSGGPSFNLQGQVVGIHSNISGSLAINNDVAMEPFYKFWDAMLSGKRIGGKFDPNVLAKPPTEPEGPAESKEQAEPKKSDVRASNAGRPRDIGGQSVAYRRVSLLVGTTAQNEQQQQSSLDQEPQIRPDTELQRLLKKSRDSQGRLEIDRDRLRRLRDQLNQRVEALSPVGGRQRDAWGEECQAAFAPQVKCYSPSLFAVIVSGRKVATALVVDAAGYLVTKASEVEGRTVFVANKDELKIPAEIVHIERELDIALLKISTDGVQLVPVNLSAKLQSSPHAPGKGVLCCAVGTHQQLPAGFGVVSVAARALNGNTSAYLGATKQKEIDGGIRLDELSPNGPAERAGLKSGDIVESLDDEKCANIEGFTKLVESRLPNEIVTLGIRRGDSWLTMPVQLGDKSKVAVMPGAREQETDGMSTKMSRRRWKFIEGIQHDSAIQPSDCGGPLVDLHGNLLGINIARAGRIKSYAIPIRRVAEFVSEVLDRRGEESK